MNRLGSALTGVVMLFLHALGPVFAVSWGLGASGRANEFDCAESRRAEAKGEGGSKMTAELWLLSVCWGAVKLD